jgi:hypothetical protein
MSEATDPSELANRRKTTPVPIRLFGWFLILVGVAWAVHVLFFGGAFGFPRALWNGAMKLLAAISGWGFLQMRWWGPILYFAGFAAGTAVFFVAPPSAESLAVYMRPSSLAMLFVIPALVGGLVWYYRDSFR